MKTIYDPYSAVGGNLCLDFINTLGGHRLTSPIEYLHSYSDLVHWAKDVNIIDDSLKERLLLESKQNKLVSTEVFSYAIQIRETLYRLTTSLMTGTVIGSDDLDFFNKAVSKTNSQKVLTYSFGRMVWSYSSDFDLERIIWPIIESACDIFTGENLTRIRECGNETCSWLFLDSVI